MGSGHTARYNKFVDQVIHTVSKHMEAGKQMQVGDQFETRFSGVGVIVAICCEGFGRVKVRIGDDESWYDHLGYKLEWCKD